MDFVQVDCPVYVMNFKSKKNLADNPEAKRFNSYDKGGKLNRSKPKN